MSVRKSLLVLFAGIFIAALFSIPVPLTAVHAQTCGIPGAPACPPPPPPQNTDDQSPPKKKPAPRPAALQTSTPTRNAIQTFTAETLTAQPSLTPTATPCVLCPLPTVPPTLVAGPVFLRPGVINMLIIVALIALLAGVLFFMFRGSKPSGPIKPPNPNQPPSPNDSANQFAKFEDDLNPQPLPPKGVTDGAQQFDKHFPNEIGGSGGEQL